jgi:phage nucleotide-binding protein
VKHESIPKKKGDGFGEDWHSRLTVGLASRKENTIAATLTEKTLGGLRVEPITDTVQYINMLVYGYPGAGKTVLSGSADGVPDMRPVLVIDVEGGTLSLRDRYPDVDVVRVQSWDDMQKVYDALYSGEHDYKTIVLDSLTEIQKFSMYKIMEAVIREDPGRDPDIPSVREWGKSIEQIRKLVRAFRDLPMHTVFTALAKEDKDPKTGVKSEMPSLPGKLAPEVAGFVDIVAFLYVKVVDSEFKRLLLTLGTDKHVAKDRTDKLPQIMEDPTMETILAHINGEGE